VRSADARLPTEAEHAACDGSAQSTATARRRYGCVASIYDWANLERVLYAGYPEGERRGDAVIPRPSAWALSKLFAADCTRCPPRLLQRDTGNPMIERFT
jgi:hypothetical protein